MILPPLLPFQDLLFSDIIALPSKCKDQVIQVSWKKDFGKGGKADTLHHLLFCEKLLESPKNKELLAVLIANSTISSLN